MLYQRILTGVIGGAVFLGLVILGDAWFFGLISLLAIIGYSELLHMKGYKYFTIPSLAGFLLVETWIYYGTSWLSNTYSDPLLWVVFGFLFLTVLLKNRFAFHDVSYMLVGTVYIGLSLHYAWLLRNMQSGLALFLFVQFAIWATDIFAYFVGRLVKGPKVWPSISPNKTISGTIGGFVAAAIVGAVFSAVLQSGHTVLQWMVLAVIISLAGQVGDFVESGIKRSLNVKDSGAILPGHGGILDRFDSWLFAAPIAYHLLLWFGF